MSTLRCAGGREFDPRPWQYSRMSFSSDQVTGTVFHHLNNICLSFQIYLEHCPRGEALIISHMRFSSNEVASHVKQLPFRPLLSLLYGDTHSPIGCRICGQQRSRNSYMNDRQGQLSCCSFGTYDANNHSKEAAVPGRTPGMPTVCVCSYLLISQLMLHMIRTEHA